MCARCRCSSGCCGKRGATVFFALAGLLLAAAVIVPPVYVHETDKDYTKLFPILKYGRIYLEKAAEKYGPSFDETHEIIPSVSDHPTDPATTSTSQRDETQPPTSTVTVAVPEESDMAKLVKEDDNDTKMERSRTYK